MVTNRRAPDFSRFARATVALWFALGALAVFFVADAIVFRQPGVAVLDRWASGLVPVAILIVAGAVLPRLRTGIRGWLSTMIGVLGVIFGSAAMVRTIRDDLGIDLVVAALAIAGGGALVAIGVRDLQRARPRAGSLLRKVGVIALVAAVTLATAALVLTPLSVAFVTTHAARERAPMVDLGVPYEDVSFRTSDGLVLYGWYAPSRNSAAVIAFPGRTGPVDHARLLVSHGYGVLLFDPRGKGESQGDPNALGWHMNRDLKAAIAFLQGRPDVDPDRIGGLGLSVAGEMLLQTAAETESLKAVVAEGAGIRSYREALHLPVSSQAFNVPFWLSMTAGVAVFTSSMPPPDLTELVAKIAPRAVFLIHAADGQGGEELTPDYYEAAGEPKVLWTAPEGGHTGALDAQPEEYERRVIDFFDEALLN